jgi:hypothetical protein
MFINRQSILCDADANIAITLDSICAGQREVPQFCAGTSLVAFTPKPNFSTGPRPVHDLSWWKPFLQLCGPDRVIGPEDAKQLFNKPIKQTAPEDIIIDHREDDVHVPYDQRSTLFSSMRNRKAAASPAYTMPAYHDDPVTPAEIDDDYAEEVIPAAYVIAERVTAPIELRFFPNRNARAPRVADC